MELCTPRTFSNLPSHSHHLQWKPSLLLKNSPKSRFNPGLLYRKNIAIRSTSEESSSFTSATEAYELYEPPKETGAYELYEPPKETGSGAYELYEPPNAEEKENRVVQSEAPIEDSADSRVVQNEAPTEYSALEFEAQLSKLLDKLNIKVDPENSSSVVLLGGGALIALWLTAAVVGAIDSIPLFPKLMELVGLGYALWFSTRYLIFKKNRDELAAKIDELKQEVLGSKN